MKNYLINLCLVLSALCVYTDPLWDQFADRFVAGQIMFASKNYQNYEDFLNNVNYMPLREFQSECQWGFFFRIQKENKTPMGGLVIKF